MFEPWNYIVLVSLNDPLLCSSIAGSCSGDRESMAEIWVTKPGEEQHLPEVEAEAARLQAELRNIQSLSDESACRLCGIHASLTKEHTPSKKAGNLGKMIRQVIDYASSVASGIVKWNAEIIQGATFEALCGLCNNRTGSWYNPAYIKFARYCREFAQPENVGKLCRLELSLHRQRIAKQALLSLVATSQPGLTARYPDLRTLLLGKEDRRPMAPIRLWLYLKANPGACYTGITIALDLERRKGHLVAGFSFWPLGWLMTIGDVAVKDAANVSVWTGFDYHDKAPVTVEVPCRWAISPYPGDFRGPDEIPSEAWSVKD